MGNSLSTVSLSGLSPLAGQHLIPCSSSEGKVSFYQHCQLPGLVRGAQMLCRAGDGLVGISLMRSTDQVLL